MLRQTQAHADQPGHVEATRDAVTDDGLARRACYRCGQTVGDGDAFCPRCGTALPDGKANGPFPAGANGSTPLSALGRRLSGKAWTPAPPEPEAAPSTASASVGDVGGLPVTMSYAGHQPRRRRRRRRARRWYRRPLLVAPAALGLLLIVIVGAVLIRAELALSTLHSTSALGPTVSGELLGGDATIQIDTSAAMLALTGGSEEDGGGFFDQFRGAASGVQDLAGGVAVATGLKDAPADTMTILLMGVDARPGEPIDISTRPDALIVLHLNPEADTCRLLSIPRDTRANLPGYGLTKINNALVVGGIGYQRQVVEEFLGIEVDRYALIDFTGFEALVDAVGGVTINVPEDFKAHGVEFTAGRQSLDGEQALAYARYRGGPEHDLGRIRNQQQLIQALVRTASGRNVVRDVNDLLPALERHIRTDMTSSELIGLAEQYRTRCTAESIPLRALDGRATTADDPLLRQSLSYLIVSEAEVRQKVAELTGAVDIPTDDDSASALLPGCPQAAEDGAGKMTRWGFGRLAIQTKIASGERC